MNVLEQLELKPISRRSFLRLATLGAGTMVAITVAGKAGAQQLMTTPTKAPVKPVQKLRSTISNNHGHTFLVSLDNLKKAGAKSYNIQGSAGHPHQIDVTADVLKALFAVKVVDIESTQVAGHTHVVRLQIV